MRRMLAATVTLVALGFGGVALAEDDLTSLSYISYLERYATITPARDAETIEAVVNMPVIAGDRLETARGARLEVQLASGSTVWIDEFTTLDFDSIAYSRDDEALRTALYLPDEGGIGVEVPSDALGDGTVRVETPSGTAILNRPGLYRLEIRSGQLHVEAHRGLAEIPDGYGSTLLRGGQEAWLDGDEIDRNVLAGSSDDFWRWVTERRSPQPSTRTAEYLDSRSAARAYVLDSYGDWVWVSSFSAHMWRPRVSLTWQPYTHGRWVWTPVGWTWVAYEPWGWYPSHYGSWYWDASFGWLWHWDRVWSPAWVHWVHWDGYVGWCPRGYYDWWYWNTHREYHPGTPWNRHRWADVTIDFSGSVRLRRLDSRPWTIVASGDFTTSRLDRVRLDPGRVLRDVSDDRVGRISSGPLLTEAPGSRGGGRLVDDALRGSDRGGRDLSGIFSRDENAVRTARDVPFTPVRTDEVAARAPRSVNRGAGVPRGNDDAGERLVVRRGREAGGDDAAAGSNGGRAVRSDQPGSRTVRRVDPGNATPGRVERPGAERSDTGSRSRTVVTPRRVERADPGSSGSSGTRDTTRSDAPARDTSRPSSPPPGSSSGPSSPPSRDPSPSVSPPEKPSSPPPPSRQPRTSLRSSGISRDRSSLSAGRGSFEREPVRSRSAASSFRRPDPDSSARRGVTSPSASDLRSARPRASSRPPVGTVHRSTPRFAAPASARPSAPRASSGASTPRVRAPSSAPRASAPRTGSSSSSSGSSPAPRSSTRSSTGRSRH